MFYENKFYVKSIFTNMGAKLQIVSYKTSIFMAFFKLENSKTLSIFSK